MEQKEGSYLSCRAGTATRHFLALWAVGDGGTVPFVVSHAFSKLQAGQRVRKTDEECSRKIQDVVLQGVCCFSSHQSLEQSSGGERSAVALGGYSEVKSAFYWRQIDCSAGRKSPSQAVLFSFPLQLCLSFFPLLLLSRCSHP